MAWPSTDNPKSSSISLRLTQKEMDALDAYAARNGVTRSVATRAILNKTLRGNSSTSTSKAGGA